MTATVAFTKISTEPFRLTGGARERIVTLTLTTSSDHAYTNGGIADTTNFGSLWHLKLDMRKINYVVPMTALRSSDFETSFDFEVDVTNRKVVLTRPGGTAYTASIASVGAPVTSFTDAANGFVTAGFQPGDIILASGNATAAGNGIARVTAVAAGTLTVAACSLTATAAASMTLTKISGEASSEIVDAAPLPNGTYTATVRVIGS